MSIEQILSQMGDHLGLLKAGSRGTVSRQHALTATLDWSFELLTEAVIVLRGSTARLELARALLDLGAAHRRAGARGTARDLLRESLDLAHGLGGQPLLQRRHPAP